ncbi:PaaI family thioesterase [Azohydromonas caseinilytica]|nr:PaaI family thioesterase [Azohydromonas caseinilytica]
MMAPGFADAPGGADNPLLQHLGIELAEVAAGRAVFRIDLDRRHLNRQGSLQGGVAATLLDAACGYAGLVGADGQLQGNAVTVMLNVAYLRKVSRGRLRATGTVTRAGRSMYFATGELATESGELIATAQGAFKRNSNASGE